VWTNLKGMKNCRLSPGLFITGPNQNPKRKDEIKNDPEHVNRYLYAFCGEDYTCERYNLKKEKWEKIDYIYPENFHARYGIMTYPMWHLPGEFA
jgi:hypothetical protein